MYSRINLNIFLKILNLSRLNQGLVKKKNLYSIRLLSSVSVKKEGKNLKNVLFNI